MMSFSRSALCWMALCSTALCGNPLFSPIGGWMSTAATSTARSTATSSEQDLEQAYQRAGTNRAEIEKAVQTVQKTQKAGMEFLIRNMPESDLKTLTAEFLIENSEFAWKALQETAWKDSIPEDVIFDSLLPYASINERRDRWRKDFYERFAPLVAGVKTPGEAAVILNQKIFPTLNVRYSTGRKKADQSPYESIESGLASCTGLSVLLVDACRAVGVPARIVGTPLWKDRSGNHTWVEIWDQGWKFTGACEPTGNKLNEAWFIDRARQAEGDHPLHAIYAVTFRRNGQSFPMVWALDDQDVFAVNVTDRYRETGQPVPEGYGVVRIRVRKATGKSRTAVKVRLEDSAGQLLFEGVSKDERFDANDHLTASLKIGQEITAVAGDRQSETKWTVTAGEQLIDLHLPAESDSVEKP